MKPTYKILKDAREIVKTRWQKGAYGANGGPRCAAGAIAEVSGYDLSISENCLAARLILSGSDEPYLSIFNDNSTHEEVISAFTKAMRKAR